MNSKLVCGLLSLGGVLGFQSTANASFHLMQIEQVIGSVEGDVTAQAVQLRMRSGFQNLVHNAKLVVRDAAGNNPVVILDIASDVSNSALGTRILIASDTFASHSTPAAIPDFLMANIIPQSYLAAGSLTFERDTTGVLWRLSWGGAAYTGLTTGETTNDADGDFGPPVATSLPSCGAYAWVFKNAANAKSVTNLADYRLTSEQVVPFFNSAGQSFTVSSPLPVVKIQATDANANEQPNSDTGKMRITRTSSCLEPSLKVSYTIAGTATNGTDYNTLQPAATVPANGANKVVTITAINDVTPEADETVILKLKTDPSYTIGSPPQAKVTIHSNE
jgi:hypothetical protein